MRKCVLFLLMPCFLAVTDSLPAQGTAFTYQGQLQNNGSPANGNYDFTFALFNTNSTNSGQVGGTLTNLAVGVTNGLFTLPLDFGNQFPGANRWLAIGVRTNGGSGFTALSPLQALTPTPYAIYATNAGTAANLTGTVPDSALSNNVALLTRTPQNFTGTNAFAGSVGIGTTTPGTTLDVVGQMRVNNAATSIPTTGTFGGVGTRLVLWPGAASVYPYALGIDNGTLWNSVPGGSLFNWYVGGVSLMALNNKGLGLGTATPDNMLDVQGSADFTGNVGIGTTSPAAPLHVVNSGLPTIITENSSTAGTWLSLRNDSTGGNNWNLVSSGSGNGEGAGKLLFNDQTSGGTVMTLQNNGSVGIGNTAPTTALQVNGTVTATAFSGDGSGLTNISATAVGTPPPGMVLIPAGSFTMGNSTGDGDIPDAVPITVTVSAFYLDVNLVSLSQWQSVYYWATNHGYGFDYAGGGKAANNPVQAVDWYDVVKWCNARSEQAGRTPAYYTTAAQTTVYRTGEIDLTNGCVNWAAAGYRLPTEAEWEKGARGGVSGQRFPWGNVINEDLANYFGATGGFNYDLGPNGYNPIGSIGGTSPATSAVSSFAANGYGLYDMAGNVSEWCWDWYGTYAGGANPEGPVSGSYRVFRGGDWGGGANNCRSAIRFSYFAAGPDPHVGFRSALPFGQ